MTVTEPAEPLRITLFGPMQVLVRGQALAPLRSRKALWLLALLALRQGRTVEREWLAETLWPDTDTEQALASLRTVLSELRKALGPESARLALPNRHSLCLERDGAWVDVSAFDAAILRRTLPALEQAIAFYRGPLLEGCAEEWAPQERDAREQDCLRALQTLAEAALAAGNPETAADYYRQAVALDPWREDAQRGLMEALAADGDRNAALEVYRQFTAFLRRDPAAAPDEQTTALYRRLRAEARRRADRPAPERSAVESGPSGGQAAVTTSLPYPLTGLVGREDERLEVSARLRRSRLVTLVGPGGIGKTRLALAVAAETAPEFTDGSCLVSLEAVPDGTRVAGQIAATLGLREGAGKTLLERATDHLRQRRLLLALDNCEHVLDASAQVVRHLLRECPGVRVLATSREPLGLTGEAVWSVPTLAVPDPAHLPAGRATLLRVLTGYESVQLFVERAQAVQKTFSLTGGNALAVARVCASLEGLPLAIELAAARVKALTVEQIAARLDDHLGLLTGGDRAGQPRQQTLRATLDWSYGLLTGPEQVLLERLSVFAGGWSLEAAEAVCSGAPVESGQVADLLASLVDKSLVLFEAEGDAGDGRYRLLETVRQYAARRLENSGGAATARARHRDFFLRFAEDAEPRLTGTEQARLLARLETEHGNLRAALGACGAQDGLRLAWALWRFWELRGHYTDGRFSLMAALGRPGAGEPSAARAKALNAAGVLAHCQGDHESARALHAESLEISQDLGDRQDAGWSLYDLGKIAAAQGDLRAADALFAQSLAIFQEAGHRRGVGSTLHQVGSLAGQRGRDAEACALYEQSLEIFRELGNHQGIAWALNDLGSLARERGDRTQALALYEESLAISRELGHRRGIGWALHQIGGVVREQGDAASARALLEESLAISRDLADKQSIAWLLNDLGTLAREQGDYAEAQARHEESLRISRELSDRQGAAWSQQHLGHVAAARGDHAVARALFERSLPVFREFGNRPGIGWTLYYLGEAVRAQGDGESAWRVQQEGLAVHRGINSQFGMVKSLQGLGKTALDRGDAAMARALFAESIGMAREMRDRDSVAAGLEGLAAARLARDEAGPAARLWGTAQALRESLGSPTPERETSPRPVQEARARMGEEAFAAAWAEGHARPWKQAVKEALAEEQPPVSSAVPASRLGPESA